MSEILTFTVSTHPLATYVSCYGGLSEAPEFVVDDVLAAGTVAFAGERGLGKTSACVPLMMVCTGLLIGYPLTASIRRRVIYVTEDVQQVRRIISAMRAAGMIQAAAEELDDWFHIVEAKRMPAHEIVKAVPFYDDLYTPNPKAGGGIYMAPPVLVLDTANASIDLDNISDNAEVSATVALLRQKFGDICLVIVGHVSKASRSDARQLSFIGAGAWEGDTQQTLYLVSDNGERFLVLGKRRFEAEIGEYRIVSHGSSFDATDKLGRTVCIKCFFGVPEAVSDAVKQAAKEKRQSEQKLAAWQATLNRVKQYVTANPGATTRQISEAVSGKAASVRAALEQLVDTGEVRADEGANRTKTHYPVIGTHWDTPEDFRS